jgi:glycosyltransferase involved in cell wall biosynthesis
MNSAYSPRLLLVLPLVPWPVRRDGFSVRFAPIVEYLAHRYSVDILVLAEACEGKEPSGPLRLCRSFTVLKLPVLSLPRFARRVRVAWSALVPWGIPLGSAGHLARRKLEQEVAQYLERESHGVVIWAAGHYDSACRVRVRYPSVRFVMDFVDSPSLRVLRTRVTRPDRRLLARYTAWKLRRLERRVQAVFDATIYVSDAEARAACANPPPHVYVIPNGIMQADSPVNLPRAPAGSHVIGFLGSMDYQPNVSAVLRLAERIMPRLLLNIADTQLIIIGRDPAPEIRALQSPTITVTGTVEDIWPHMAQIRAFVLPMIEGTGLQNKILEAMYAGVPVVTTSAAAAGVGAKHSENLLVADSDEDIAVQTLRLLRDVAFADQLAQRARQFVMRSFDWNAILPRYEAVVMQTGPAHGAAARLA